MYKTIRTKQLLTWNENISVWLRTAWLLRQPLTRRGLIHQYLLDWDATDSIWASNGTATNVTWVANDIWYTNEKADLNGSSSYITASHSYSWAFAIAVWVNFDAFKSNDESQIYRITWAWSTNIGFSHINTVSFPNQFQFFANDWTSWSSIYVSSFTPATGNWYLVIWHADWTTRYLTILDEEWNIYEGSSWTAVSITLSWTANIYRHPTAWRYLDGKSAFLRIYNRGLSRKDIKELYYEGVALLH